MTRWHGHHSRVVDQDVERPSRSEGLLRKRLDRREAGEVEVRRRHIGARIGTTDVGDRDGALLRVADGQHDGCAPGRERTRGLESDAAVATRDNGELAGEVGDVDLVSLPRDGCTVQV
jgi:hypothetical protein